MVHSHSPQSRAFNSKLNQKKAMPLSSFLSSARTPLRDLTANVEDPHRKPNDGKAALKGNDSPKKPLRVLDNIRPKKVAPRNDANQQPKRSQNITLGAALQRTDRQRTAARSKASDHRPFKVYDDAANEEQVASMRSSRSSARDEAIGKVRRALLHREQAAGNGQDIVRGSGKPEATPLMNDLVSPIKASPLAPLNSNVTAFEKSPNGTHFVEKEPCSPVSFLAVPTNSPVTPAPPKTSTPTVAAAPVTVTPVATHVPSRGPSASQADCTPILAEGSGTDISVSAKSKFLRSFSGDSQRSSVEPTEAADELAPALATCSIAAKPADMRPILGRKIVGSGSGSPPWTRPTNVPMCIPFRTRNTAIMKLPGFEHLTEYFPDRVEEIQRFYRDKENRRRKAIESMIIQNTRQTKQEVASAVSLVDLRREPTGRNGFGGLPVEKQSCCNLENKYGAIGQTKNGYAPGVCARQLGLKQAVIEQRISYETEELLRMNFLVCGNLWYDRADSTGAGGTLSNYF